LKLEGKQKKCKEIEEHETQKLGEEEGKENNI
jgi:hypothetical protein